MQPKIIIREGWIEVEIDNDCKYPRFIDAADLLNKQFQIRFTEKLNHLDDAYWDFIYKGCELTLHFNHFCGISLFSTKYGKATIRDNECAKEIGTLLFEKINHPS